ncbi:nitroreductase family protein [Streptomyces tropicalis]|uniref:Nitroreductase family protein n=1 Tax=Streptomyces tropicalis TaxID=3034234 RepID=A0ABT6A9T4_9ACTN|nr:nitroreductase family protein [Streptomyces tropicalis]MDF3301403.1 nitroreductase family protein [Streptomyces tropicalis]
MTGPGPAAGPVLAAIRTRRVTRALTDEPVRAEDLHTVLRSARYAPHAGNRRLHRFVAVDRQHLLDAIRLFSPGMLQRPKALIAICVDENRVRAYGFPPHKPGPFIDVGTAAATMLLAAHSLGLGAGPVTSFSKAAVATLLGLDPGVTPHLMVCLGHPAPEQPPGMNRARDPWDDFVQWNRG